MPDRAYDLIRTLVERLDGKMVYERAGHRYGAWVIRIGNASVTIEAGGNRAFPELDRLHVPRVPNPERWDDYSNDLVPDAEAKLLSLLGILRPTPTLLPENATSLSALVARTKWKFAWTYARTYPHEYTTEALCAPEDHTTLIDYIERYGVVQRFGQSLRRYFCFEERKYWHMGDPHSGDPVQWPKVINRAWVDVTRHAVNVEKHWTAEEVGLQKRIWQIRAEIAAGHTEPKPTL